MPVLAGVLAILVMILIAVLGGNKSSETPFVNNGGGSVTDTRTGLMWAARDNGSDIDWDDAKRYCEDYRGGAYSDWRMPTINELTSLYDSRVSQPVNCGGSTHCVPAIELTCDWVWSSELAGSSDARYFLFRLGFAYSRARSTSYYSRALPVRSR